MRNKLEKHDGQSIQDADDGRAIEPRRQSPFGLSFHYSYASMESASGKTHIKAQRQSFEEGKLESEQLEATIDGDAPAQAAEQLQGDMMHAMGRLFDMWAAFLPRFGGKKR